MNQHQTQTNHSRGNMRTTDPFNKIPKLRSQHILHKLKCLILTTPISLDPTISRHKTKVHKFVKLNKVFTVDPKIDLTLMTLAKPSILKPKLSGIIREKLQRSRRWQANKSTPIGLRCRKRRKLISLTLLKLSTSPRIRMFTRFTRPIDHYHR